ncbi:hypothetical protein [Leuconostoc gasicomitatum]|uniref:hypothetical protein n=1 Tax=Leuconostoc gasicomitatum TaxID=115778 RepID=UPI0015C6AB02|nr:hypothetical protein [Leuconostoc gasicomitatum]QLG77561.1 hypothetical protein LeuG3613_01280 [Leuconostoc gasicomitatum]
MLKDDFIENIEKLIFTEASDGRLDDPEFEQKVVEIWRMVNSLEGDVIPYARISQIVFKEDQNNTFTDDNIANTILRMEEAVSKIRENNLEDEQLRKGYGIDKVIQNLDLANTQKVFLYKVQQNDINQIREKYGSKLNDLDNQAKHITHDVDQKVNEFEYAYETISEKLNKTVDTRMNTIYSGFVSVLGIFVSISFTLFGAATLLKNIFTISTTKGFDTTPAVIGANIMLAGFATLLIYLLLIGLMQSVSSVTKINYDFSLRRTFIVTFIAVGIIISGALYKDPNLNFYITLYRYKWVICSYLIIGILTYRFGSKLKDFILKRQQSVTIKFLATLKTPLNQDYSGKITNLQLRIRNTSNASLYIREIWIGDKKESEVCLDTQYINLVSKEAIIKNYGDNNEVSDYLSPTYYNKAQAGKLFAYIHTNRSVIRIKVKSEKKIRYMHIGSFFKI